MSTRPVVRLAFITLATVMAVAGATPGPQAQAPAPTPVAGFAPTTTHDGAVYVAGILPGPAPAAAALEDDIRAQTARVLDELSVRLRKAGSSLDRVLTLHVYLRRAADFAAMNEVWARHWPKDAPSRTTVIAEPPAPGALIQVAAVAAAPGASRDVIHPEGWLKSPSPYSYAIRSGDTLYLAGLVARRGTDNTFVAGDIATQTRTALVSARLILAAAGFTVEDVVSARVFLTDVANFAAMNEAYRAAWPRDPPARATVVTGLMSPDYLVEITLTAVKGAARKVITTPNAGAAPTQPNPNLSSAIGIGSRLFLSGMLGVVPGAPPDAAWQAKEILARLDRTMTAGGATWRNVVDSVVYVTSAAAAPAVVDALRERCGGTLPTGTIAVTGLVSAEGLAEIMLTAGK